MSVDVDPLELLARADPVPDERALPPTRAYLPAQRTLERILDLPLPVAAGSPRRQAEQRHRRRRRVALATGAAVVALVAAAAAWVVTRSASDTSRVACYAAAARDADVVLVQARAGVGPLAQCSGVWASGEFQAYGPVPPLAACVLSRGDVGVFPGDPSVCDRLGLPRVATDSGNDASVSVQLVDNLVAALAAPNCVDVTAAVDLVHQELDRLGLVGWTLITPATAVPGRPCTSIAFDPPAKTITLVPIPRPPGSS